MIQWNPLVNQEFILEGDYGHEDGLIKTKFESGKERAILKNTYLPMEYPVSLILDNITPVTDGLYNTEYKQFVKWYEDETRYGTLPFSADIADADYYEVIYKITTVPKYDGIGTVTVKFNVRVESSMPKDLSTDEVFLLIVEEQKYIVKDQDIRIRLLGVI